MYYVELCIMWNYVLCGIMYYVESCIILMYELYQYT